MNRSGIALLWLLALLVVASPARAMEIDVTDLYRTDGFIHEIEVADGYVVWIESPEDQLAWRDYPGSPLDLYISDRSSARKISTPEMRPVLPAKFDTQLGRVAWYGQGPALPTDEVWLILYEGGINTPIAPAAPRGQLPEGYRQLRAAIEGPMVAFGALISLEGTYYQHIMLWDHLGLQTLSLTEYPGIHHYSPAIDSQRVVWCTEILPTPEDDRTLYIVEIWEGGVLLDLADMGTVPIANATANGRLILWNQTATGSTWSPDNTASTIYGWDEEQVRKLSSSDWDGNHHSAPYHNRRSAAWRVENASGPGNQIWVMRNEFSNKSRPYPTELGTSWDMNYYENPVISEAYLVFGYKNAGGKEIEGQTERNLYLVTKTDSDIWIEWGVEANYSTDTPYNEYMARADHPFVTWVRDEGSSRVVVLAEPIVDVTLETVLNQTFFHPGDSFVLDVVIDNQSEPLITDLFVALEVAGQYFFWPAWNEIPAGVLRELPGSEEYTENILDFTFPPVDHTLTDIRFWGALVWHSTYVLLDYDMVVWGYGP